jgi:hypothetical protein
MEFADLARWTPVRRDFSGPAPAVDLADLSAERFAVTVLRPDRRRLGVRPGGSASTMATCPPPFGSAWPHGLEADPAAIERMMDESRFYAKDPAARVFAGDSPERRAITDTMREAAQRLAEPGYHALPSDG